MTFRGRTQFSMLDIKIPISLHAKVECLNGSCGKVSQAIINPVTQTVTHIVIQNDDFENSDQRLVSLEHVISSEPNRNGRGSGPY